MTDQNSQFFAILTATGEAKQANADAMGVPWTFSQLGVGDANGTDPIPSRTQTRLINERRRAPLNQLKIDPANASIIIAEQVIPPDVGGWWIREIGLYDSDGDLVAVANCAPSFKPLLSQGTGKTQVVRLNIIVTSTANVQLKIDPAVVLATRQYVDSSLAAHLQESDPHTQYQLRGSVTSLNTDTVLNAQHTGMLLLDASAGARTYTLPANNAALGVRDYLVRRTDNGGNRLVVRASGTDKIKCHTHLRAEGYPFFVLMGSGDWWHLRSDGAGNWWPIARYDNTPLGRSVFETTTVFQPGGWGRHMGHTYNRAEWPWLWDHAQASGMLTTEALRAGNEGCWTSGDGETTFRSPEARGEFVRMLDESRGVDPGRVAGSRQKGSLVQGDNGIGDDIVFATNIYAQKQQLGMDTAPFTDYAGVSLKYLMTNSMPLGTLADGDLINHGGVTRPRNIAYPGRIKLI
ncbi:phage tail protein [Pseudomonas alkylphenolica]|uniref:phage tail protein n=1 Tax=Pseudomonas alkylphenolica TaxID=237609 RepID=UPI001E537559|nr:phage tail protein [Pseudomonas alkylphenolica]